jgi:hypothetical protein
LLIILATIERAALIVAGKSFLRHKSWALTEQMLKTIHIQVRSLLFDRTNFMDERMIRRRVISGAA